MKKFKYEKMIEEILGNEKYKELKEYTIKRVKEKFEKQTKYIAKKLIYVNHSAILIIAILKTREASNEEISKKLYINSNKYFIEKDINKFIDVYSEYINIICKEINKTRSI